MMYYSMQNRKMPSMRTVWVYLIASLVLALFSGMVPGTVTFSMLAVCLSTMALLSIPRISYPRVLLILLVMALVSSGLTLLLTRNGAACFASAAFAPASALLTLTIRKRSSRTCGIVLGAVGLGVFYLACTLTDVLLTYHRLSFDVFKELYGSLEQSFIATANELLSQNAVSEITIDQETLSLTFRQTMMFLPSAFIGTMLTALWFATALLRRMFKIYVYGEQRFADWKVTMNRPAAWVFLIAVLILFIPLPEAYAEFILIPLNILLILIPGFFCVGCSVWRARLFRPGKHFPFFLLLTPLLIALLFIPIEYFIVFLFIMILFISFTGVKHQFSRKKQKTEPQH